MEHFLKFNNRVYPFIRHMIIGLFIIKMATLPPSDPEKPGKASVYCNLKNGERRKLCDCKNFSLLFSR